MWVLRWSTCVLLSTHCHLCISFLHINVQKLHHVELFCTSVLCDTGSELAPVSQWHHCVRVGEVMCCCRYNLFPPRLCPQVDEEAPMWGSWPNRGCVQIKCQETTVRPHGTEVATQTYHIQVGGFSFSFVFNGISVLPSSTACSENPRNTPQPVRTPQSPEQPRHRDRKKEYFFLQ